MKKVPSSSIDIKLFRKALKLVYRDYWTLNPEEKDWKAEYGKDYRHALDTVDHLLELAEQLRSKRRGKKSKDKAAKKIKTISEAARIPELELRWSPSLGIFFRPSDDRLVKAVYKDHLRFVRELHQDRKDLEQQGVRRIEEIFRQLSEKPYSLWRVIDPQKLPSPEPDEDFSPLDLLRFGFPQALSKRISFEQFKELTGNAPREGAIALTADYFGIKKETVRKKL